jgi:hypothetical protein
VFGSEGVSQLSVGVPRQLYRAAVLVIPHLNSALQSLDLLSIETFCNKFVAIERLTCCRPFGKGSGAVAAACYRHTLSQ